MMRSYPDQLERIENERLGGQVVNNQTSEHLVETTASLQAIITWAKEANVEPGNYFPEALTRLPSIVQLLATLKCREINFENAVGHEHFEDVLIDKRLWMISPREFYNFGRDWQTPAQKWAIFLRASVKPKLSRFRKQLQDRFDYKLLVDWGYGRLWKKLYIRFKTENQAQKDAIHDFAEFATKHSKLAFDLFAIFPLDYDEQHADPCSVCLSDFEHEELIMETHCNHHFHPGCLFSYWDDEHRFQNRCPECRTSQGVLREKVDFDAEREDRCFEASHGLEGLEGHHLVALQERLRNRQGFRNSPALLEMWTRSRVEWLLRDQRRVIKELSRGWDVII